MEQVMLGKVATLREQMVSAATLEDGEAEGEQPGRKCPAIGSTIDGVLKMAKPRASNQDL